MDDILIHGISQEEHDGRVRKVLQRLQEAGLECGMWNVGCGMWNVSFPDLQ